MVLQQEAADKKAEEDANKRIRKKLRQKGGKLKQERWKQERLKQDKLEEIRKRSIKENREAQEKARVEERTKKAILETFKNTNTPEGLEVSAIIAKAFSEKRTLFRYGALLQGLRVLRKRFKEATGIRTGTKYHDDVLTYIEKEVNKGLERGEQEVEKLRGQEWATKKSRQCTEVGCQCNDGNVEIKSGPFFLIEDIKYQKRGLSTKKKNGEKSQHRNRGFALRFSQNGETSLHQTPTKPRPNLH